jgi:ApeA N-terminal domain 1
MLTSYQSESLSSCTRLPDVEGDQVDPTQGMWWLPGRKNHAVQGTLSSEDGERYILAVTGFLDPEPGPFPSEYPIILGVSHSGQLITLNNCVQRRRQLSLSGFPQVRYDEYRVQRALFDAHFPSADAVRFYRIDVRYSHLPDWAQLSGFNEQMTLMPRQANTS